MDTLYDFIDSVWSTIDTAWRIALFFLLLPFLLLMLWFEWKPEEE
jgi:hypothetical protein